MSIYVYVRMRIYCGETIKFVTHEISVASGYRYGQFAMAVNRAMI